MSMVELQIGNKRKVKVKESESRMTRGYFVSVQRRHSLIEKSAIGAGPVFVAVI